MEEFTSENPIEEPIEAPEIDYVAMTLNSGVKPLEMRFAQINGTYSKAPVAYRGFTYINSMTMGVLTQERYSYATDIDEVGIRLCKWNIEEGIKSVRRLEKFGRHVDFISVRCPAALVRKADLYEWVKGIFKENSFDEFDKICLEFPESVLFEDVQATRLAILNMKILKVKTMMSGCGADDCPMAKLLQLPFDYAVMDTTVSNLITDRDRGAQVGALIAFLRTSGITVIASGIRNDDQIAALSRADVMGYIPSVAYQGNIDHGPLRMTVDEALTQREGDL